MPRQTGKQRKKHEVKVVHTKQSPELKKIGQPFSVLAEVHREENRQ
jgi:hypothetical protein